MKKGFLAFISFFIMISGMCQTPQFTQYFLDGFIYNPAACGEKDAICTNVYGRQQWLGFYDERDYLVSPFSVMYSIHSPLYSINSGIGLNVLYDKLGYEENEEIRLNYSYKFTFNDEKSVISIGTSVSLFNKTIDFERLILNQPADPVLKVSQSDNGIVSDLSLGILYKQDNLLRVGLSVYNILTPELRIGNIIYTKTQNLFFNGEYKIGLSKDTNKPLYLIPSVFVKTNFYNAQTDLNLRLESNNKYWGGVSYRYQDAVALMAGLNIGRFNVGAAYDITIGNLSSTSKGSVELFIGYCCPISPKVKAINLYNTRYL